MGFGQNGKQCGEEKAKFACWDPKASKAAPPDEEKGDIGPQFGTCHQETQENAENFHQRLFPAQPAHHKCGATEICKPAGGEVEQG